MKRILLCLLVACSLIAKAQVYNNEWIDYSKTYYKFKVGRTGLYRIPQALIAANGLGGASAEHFQLWRNGVQIPIYTSIPSGSLGSSDYLEFWGEINDGKPDKGLYRDPDYHLNDKWSLHTDSSTYFLTINASGTSLRLTSTPNNVAGNTLAPEPFFMHTIGAYFRDKINGGYAVLVDKQYLYSSSYDKGEGWSSGDIGSNSTHSISFPNLQVYAAGPAASFNIAVSGNAISPRKYLARINNDSITGGELDFYDYARSSGSFPVSLLSSNTATVQVTNVCNQSPCPAADRMVIHKYEITYPRIFDFSNARNFEFVLPATATGTYLEIKNFDFGTSAPVLYDLTNGKRYVGDVSSPAIIKLVVGTSATERKMVLVNEDPANINLVSALEQRIFTDYTQQTNQGDYIIISNPILFNGANGSNPVEDYRAYRSSTAGGGYNAKTYLVDELIDQFGFGIKKNPLAIRNFILFARKTFAISPKHVFLIGKGVDYVTQRFNEWNPDLLRLNLIPSYGLPASDILFGADPGSSQPEISIGRLSVVSAQEITDYFKKVQELELHQNIPSASIADKAWMKNILHFSGGGGEPGLAAVLGNHMRDFKKIITDTLFGAKVYSFTKESSSTIENVSNSSIPSLYKEGFSLLSYFGHSSSSTLEFNIENPNAFENKGKYPFFLAMGCNAGNIFGSNTTRFLAKTATSENYVLTPNKGSIGFIASTHFGLVHYLGIWGNSFYQTLSNTNYGSTIGDVMKITAGKVFGTTTQDDFYSRANIEELLLMGDPAIRVNPHSKPDYAIEEAMVRINPFVSIVEKSIKLNAKFKNIGKAISDTVYIEVTHQGPAQVSNVVYRDTIRGLAYEDSLTINIPFDVKYKGTNAVTITLDAGNRVDELFEGNNIVTKQFVVYEDEAKPLQPYNFAIVNKQNIKFYASSANPLHKNATYNMEIDTTPSFNSSLKVAATTTSSGGVLEFNPNITFRDSTVYYWRVGAVENSSAIKWSQSSFIYINQTDVGFNQSHIYQHLKSDTSGIFLDTISRSWKYSSRSTNLFARNGVFGTATSTEGELTVSVEGDAFIRSACVGFSLIFNVFNPNTALPQLNTSGKYGSAFPCLPSRNWNYEYSYMSSATRKLIMDFMDSIPEGSYVVVRNITNSGQGSGFINEWMNDTALYGSGKSLYHKLKAVGFNAVDSFYTTRSFAFIYRKGGLGFETLSVVSNGLYDKIALGAEILTPRPTGNIISPILGPATQWKDFEWDGSSAEPSSSDKVSIDIEGIHRDGTKTTLLSGINLSQKKVDVSSIDASQYPYVQLKMQNSDSVNFTPYQIEHWRLTYNPVPEGAIAPNLLLSMKDTVEVNEPLTFKVAFKNISTNALDSLRIKFLIKDKDNVDHLLSFLKHKPLASEDTLNFEYKINTEVLVGANRLHVEMNPDVEQPEQFQFNNFLYKDFYVKGDTTSPFMDVTFDNRHILNNDIISPKPDILIKIKDDAKWMLLDDTSLVDIKLRYPNGVTKTFSNFNNDTLLFNKSKQPSQTDNTATINFRPYLDQDGTYELIVTGKDKSNNKAGSLDYHIAFQVINKAMISNLLNYPNPFTTSTAFVFTLTGSEVPQNIKIQILTVTGKIVREITKQELGPLQIGRNITEFKWDGTDQYGQKLANGVYLYRVVTNLKGKSLEKYKSESDNTDKYFNKGYGKMYLMR